MQSKTSYFNKTLFRKNLTRFWPLWVGASLAGSLAPATLLLALLQGRGGGYDIENAIEFRYIYYSAVSWAVPIISLLYAILCAMAVWNYLFNARSVSMMHTLPITRKGLFVTNFLSGMAMMAIPYAVTGGLVVLITLAFGIFDPVGVLVTIVSVAGVSLFYFATATLVAFVTGNAFAMPALYFIFHFLAAALEWMISSLMSQFYFGVTQAYEGFVEFLSPTICLVRNLCPITKGEEVLSGGGYRWEVTDTSLENGWLIAVYALAGMVLLACAYALYQRRRSECAGDVVAVGWMKPIFRYGVALCSALALGMALYGILWSSFQTRETVDLIPMVLCMVAGGVIGFYIASMLLAKSLRVFRSTWKGAAATVIAAAALCFAIGLDPMGVERWTPQAEAVEQIWFSAHHYGGYGYSGVSGTIQDMETIEKLVELHQQIMAERDSLELRDRGGRESDRRQAYIRLEYTLNNGKRACRDYDISYLMGDLQQQDSAIERLSRLFRDPGIQEANVFGDLDQYSRLTGGYLREVYNTQTHEMETVSLTPEEAQTLESAIRRDIALGNFGRTAFIYDGQEYDAAACRFGIRLYYTQVFPTGSGSPSSGRVDDYVNLSVSTYCTETMEALKGLESLQKGPWRLLTEAEYYALRNTGEYDGEYYDDYYDDHYDDYYGDYYGGGFSDIIYPEDAYVSTEAF